MRQPQFHASFRFTLGVIGFILAIVMIFIGVGVLYILGYLTIIMIVFVSAEIQLLRDDMEEIKNGMAQR